MKPVSLRGETLEIYKVLRSKGPMTTIQLSKELGTRYLKEIPTMVANGVVEEVGSIHSPSTGFPMIQYGVNPN